MELQSGNLFIRDMGSFEQRHDAGWKMEGHLHTFDHNTIIFMGEYRAKKWAQSAALDGTPLLQADGTPLLHLLSDGVYGSGSILFIDKNLWHSFECVTGPGKIACVYSHRDPQTGDVVQRYNGWMGAYR